MGIGVEERLAGISERTGVPSPADKSGTVVRSMFGSIAHRYDFLNHFLSLGVDRHWRARTVREVAPEPGLPVLDCCTGTADLALAFHRAGRGRTPVVGTDFCRPMLERGRRKADAREREREIMLVEADTQELPFESDTFGIVSVAFGIRNVSDTRRGIREMLRVLRPGGRLAILEFSRPRGRLLGPLYLTFFRKILPRIGQWVAPNRYQAYQYLPETVLAFPDGQEMVRLLEIEGLKRVRALELTFGIATLYVGYKADSAGPGGDA